MSSSFRKVTEQFICESCFKHVDGDGYTNHCPVCLWSKHVDNTPGDRQSRCFGMMKPGSAKLEGEEWSIVHKCILCGHEKVNKTAKDDSFEKVIEASKPG